MKVELKLENDTKVSLQVQTYYCLCCLWAEGLHPTYSSWHHCPLERVTGPRNKHPGEIRLLIQFKYCTEDCSIATEWNSWNCSSPSVCSTLSQPIWSDMREMFWFPDSQQSCLVADHPFAFQTHCYPEFHCVCVFNGCCDICNTRLISAVCVVLDFIHIESVLPCHWPGWEVCLFVTIDAAFSYPWRVLP